MSKQNYLKDAQLSAAVRGVAHPTISSVDIALYRQDGSECSGTGYARVAKTANTTNFGAPADGPGGSLQRQVVTLTDIDFGTAGADWAPSGNPVTQVRVYNGANEMYRMTKDASGNTFSMIIQSGNPVKIPAGSLGLRETTT